MMKKIAAFILAILLSLFQTSQASAEDVVTHSAYKVTSYNLGALLDNQNSGSSRYLHDISPLLITGTTSDILNSEHVGRVSVNGTTTPAANTNAIALSATFDATRSISVQGAFGVTRNLWAPDSLNYESESSWEANLGIIYKLLNNLSYELHFGYMDTGTLFNDRSSYTNVESIIMINNKLTMSF